LSTWLAPSFEARGPIGGAPASSAAGIDVEGTAQESAAGDVALEGILMSVSSGVAIAGIGLAAFIWLRRRDVAEQLAGRYPGLHRLLLNKYYVDELYDAAIVQPIHAGSREGLWRRFDVTVVDGAVNGAAALVSGGAEALRQLQTGSVRVYAGSMFIGVVMILGYYLWR
jgi:NADH-quinone oxidoreductase subunit L